MPEGDLNVREDYETRGYAHALKLAPPDVVQALLGRVCKDISGASSSALSRLLQHPEITTKPAYELYSYHYAPIMGFHWGLTSRMCEVTGKALVPTYAFFRLYQGGDVCKVHTDRPSCEHSVSMPLAYSDGVAWNFEIGHRRLDFSDALQLAPSDDFGEDAFSSVELSPGSAILYQGVNHRHGRLTPNPNRWSAHLFMHWVDTNGPYGEWAFDRWPAPPAADFSALLERAGMSSSRPPS